MLYEMNQNYESKRGNIANNLKISDTKTSTTRARQQSIVALTEQTIARYQHCVILSQLATRLSIVYNVKNELTRDGIMSVFNAHNWTCPVTRVQHSQEQPLTLCFVLPLHLGGNLSTSNLKPVYRPELLAGEWHIERHTHTPDTYRYSPQLAVMGA